MVRMGFGKKQRPQEIAPQRPLGRQHAADGLNTLIPWSRYCFKYLFPIGLANLVKLVRDGIGMREFSSTTVGVPPTRLLYYREEDGTVPIIEWLAALPRKAHAKCLAYLARLESEGHELWRPIADYLRDSIYELRPSLRRRPVSYPLFLSRQ